MKLPRFVHTLHFRISALFLLLVTVSAGAYWLWMKATVLTTDVPDEQSTWFAESAATELDTLAAQASRDWDQPIALEDLLVTFGEDVADYEVEVILFDAQGAYLCSSAPDSLVHAVNAVDPALLADMSDGEWDWSSYPVADDVDAYENRIFEVDHVFAGDETAEPAAYLVATFQPYTYAVDEMASDSRTLGVGAIVIMLSLAAVSGLIIMAWTSRRISLLSRDVAVFAGGDLGHRTTAGSSDEIGDLGRDFNAMASRIETMVGRLKDNEQFQRQLIANISHDLRTPMASLRGYVETLQLQKRSLDEEDRQRYLDIIAANLDHLDRLVDHMLVLSRFDSGQAVFEMEDFPVAELADSILMRCENLARERDVSLTLVVDEDTALVHADPLQIAQVLQNLVENGIKFNRTGGSVAIELSRRGERVQVQVRDTGLGIAPEDLPHIFERFYTGDKSRQRQPATPAMQSVRDHLGQSSGLGLAISAKIVAGHDSELQVTSKLGTGTAFGFSLQAASEPQAMTAEA